ncbi:MAG: hypothetical protein AUH69_08440 [Actinobacteria bacterium 13_1_40CM_4_65_12]|nr:MAG: hypothetical protein AUH69_08440 [Actinobacteria bacterium 13_1_40CM_4_65_12]
MGAEAAEVVSEKDTQSDQTPTREAAHRLCVASMTSLNLRERMNELSDRVIRPFNATKEGRRGSIRKSRLMFPSRSVKVR